MRSIVELMQVSPEKHDKSWLIEALQNAVQLELATLPPYLSAMWSIKDSSAEAYDLINSIVLEEMLHMALAANMLTTIGGKPVINSQVPTYPGGLPGGVRPELTVYLGGLTPGENGNVHKVFMQIEYPEAGPVARTTETYTTIGAFYTAIENAFEQLPSGSITGDKQISSSVAGHTISPITTLQEAKDAIDLIKEQGEGTPNSPEIPNSGDELAHYYKFAEIYHGKKLVEGPKGTWTYTGDPVPFPDTYPMAEVPKAGYPEKSKAFNQSYSSLLDQLQKAWEEGGTAGGNHLNSAIGTMFTLESAAVTLMKEWIDPKDHSKGTYGPSFQYVSS